MGAAKPVSNGEVSYCRRPVDRPFKQRVKYFFYNPEDGTVLGRTPHRWGVIGLIYLVMYICIIIFFSLCMCGLLAVIDREVPYYQLADSIIGDSPGMGHRPLIYEEGALIWFDGDNRGNVDKYVNHLNEFLAPYENKTDNQVECKGDGAPAGKVCSFDIKQLMECSREKEFGYSSRKPCFLIKLNKIYNWKPEYYDDPETLPTDMPEDLVKHIRSAENRRQVWVSCKGERPGDVEAIQEFKYYPAPGLPADYFPYKNVPGYLSPLVAVQMTNFTMSQIINIRCRAWARNVIYTDSLKDRPGSTHLEIMVD